MPVDHKQEPHELQSDALVSEASPLSDRPRASIPGKSARPTTFIIAKSTIRSATKGGLSDRVLEQMTLLQKDSGQHGQNSSIARRGIVLHGDGDGSSSRGARNDDDFDSDHDDDGITTR